MLAALNFKVNKMVPLRSLKIVNVQSLRRMFSNIEKNFKLEHEKVLDNSDHVYKETMTKTDIIRSLVDNVVYNKDGIIVTSKPYGFGNERSTGDEESDLLVNTKFDDILEDLAKELKENEVKVLKAPGRLASGVTILTTTNDASEKINSCWHKGKKQNLLMSTFLVVTKDKPKYETLETKFGVSYRSPHLSVLKTWSKNSLKNREVRVVFWKHKVLASSNFGSLVKVQMSNFLCNYLKLILATKCFSPVLGDSIFSPRIRKVMNVPFDIGEEYVKADCPEEFDPELLSALEIVQEETKIIPCHIHLSALKIPLSKNQNFFVSVPPPQFFNYTCKKLGLLSEEDCAIETGNSDVNKITFA